MNVPQAVVSVIENGGAAYAQTVHIGRHVLTADEPLSRGGGDAGPSPYDYLLAGLGACTVVTVRMYAERHDWPLLRTTVDLWHEKVASESSTPIVDRFHRLINFEGGLTDEQRVRLLHIADHCPVSETLRRGAIIDTDLAGLTKGDSPK